MTDDRRQRTEGRWQQTENRRQRELNAECGNVRQRELNPECGMRKCEWRIRNDAKRSRARWRLKTQSSKQKSLEANFNGEDVTVGQRAKGLAQSVKKS
jgi:hypothetical protein